MNRIEDLSHDELIALTDEQIQRYIDIEIAFQGIKPCDAPKDLSLPNAGIIATEKLYKVGELLFKNKEDAIKTASLDLYTSAYDWSISYDYRWPEKCVDLKITEVDLYKKEDVLRVSGVLQEIKNKKNVYDSDKSAFDKYLKATTSCRESVWSKISEARDVEYRIQNAIKAIENYKVIADGDLEVALKFFEKAFTDESDEIKNIALERTGLKNEIVIK